MKMFKAIGTVIDSATSAIVKGCNTVENVFSYTESVSGAMLLEQRLDAHKANQLIMQEMADQGIDISEFSETIKPATKSTSEPKPKAKAKAKPKAKA